MPRIAVPSFSYRRAKVKPRGNDQQSLVSQSRMEPINSGADDVRRSLAVLIGSRSNSPDTRRNSR
jgi:hypothetical protein